MRTTLAFSLLVSAAAASQLPVEPNYYDTDARLGHIWGEWRFAVSSPGSTGRVSTTLLDFDRSRMAAWISKTSIDFDDVTFASRPSNPAITSSVTITSRVWLDPFTSHADLLPMTIVDAPTRQFTLADNRTGSYGQFNDLSVTGRYEIVGLTETIASTFTVEFIATQHWPDGPFDFLDVATPTFVQFFPLGTAGEPRYEPVEPLLFSGTVDGEPYSLSIGTLLLHDYNADALVPEPASWLMAVLAVGGVCTLISRRRQ